MASPQPEPDETHLSPDTGGSFKPQLISTFQAGYGQSQFQRDLVAGLTVAIVALPLSMGIAIASGATPAAGLYAAIVGGFLVSAMGGSNFQIGGPAGAFIVLIASIIARHGYEGLLLASLMGGAILVMLGVLRLGGFIRLVPHAVLAGFTAAIALIIFATQVRDLLGLTLGGREPPDFLPKLAVLWQALPSANTSAATLSILVISVIIGIRHFNPKLPAFLIAIVLGAVATWMFALPVETIGTRFGGIPQGLPVPSLPPYSAAKAWMLLPDAIAIAFLAGLESLLSAAVADGMSRQRHRANAELVAQGCANMATSLFHGLCVTGTIARTATNIRAGAISPISGMLHSIFLLGFMLVAAPLAAHIPLAALAGMLAVVAWTMADTRTVALLLAKANAQSVIMGVTFALVVFVDLIVGIAGGCVLAFVHQLWRKASTPSMP